MKESLPERKTNESTKTWWDSLTDTQKRRVVFRLTRLSSILKMSDDELRNGYLRKTGEIVEDYKGE